MPAQRFSTLRIVALSGWIVALLSAMIWARFHERTEPPPSRAAFEERHRLCYDIYAASDFSHAYDLLAQTFAGDELDRQYCFYAKASKQLLKAGASVIVWDLQYENFKLLEAQGDRCLVSAKWSVVYVLGHSQHSHVRSNAYEAVFELRKQPDGWRIVSSRIVSDKNLA